jgi:transposase
VLSFLSNTRVYLAAGATDLRKSFDTLAGVVRDSLSLDPLSGHLFVFTNSRRNRIKILFWDNTGWWVCAKRLEAGTRAWPESPSPSIDLSIAAKQHNQAAVIYKPEGCCGGSLPLISLQVSFQKHHVCYKKSPSHRNHWPRWFVPR